MMIRDDLRLNPAKLKVLLSASPLKQQSLAEKVGVDRKTIIRWTQGKVKSIQRPNAEALAQVLNCHWNEFCFEDVASHLATPEDQKIAAEMLRKSSIMDRLGPLGEWNVIESLLKATIVPNLPLSALGELYNQLTVASWRQSKMSEAKIYNEKALQIAEKSKDRGVRAAARLSQGNLISWEGSLQDAITCYRECLKDSQTLSPKTVAGVLSNLGAVLCESGEYDESIRTQMKALSLYETCGNPMNLSIVHTNFALTYLKKNDFLQARASNEKALSFANQDQYRRGILFSRLLAAEIQVGLNTHERSTLEEVTESLAGFSQMNIEEPLNYEIAGRIARLLGEFRKSIEFLEKGFDLSSTYPFARAEILFEIGKTWKALGSNEKAQSSFQEALISYQKCQAPLKVQELQALLNVP